MSKFTDNASEKLLVVAGKISNQKHMARPFQVLCKR